MDPRGVRRGRCEPNCGCDQYERPPTGAPCAYCSCPPTKHVRLEENDSTNKGPATVDPGSKKNGFASLVPKENSSVPNIVQVANGSGSSNVPQAINGSDSSNVTPTRLSDSNELKLARSLSALAASLEIGESVSALLSPGRTSLIMENDFEFAEETDTSNDTSTVVNVLSAPLEGSHPQPESAPEEISALPNKSSKRGSLSSRTNSTKRIRSSDESETGSSNCMTNQLKACIPSRWPKDIAGALEKGVLLSKQRNEIVRIIVDKMIEKNLTEDFHFEEMGAVALGEKRLKALKSPFSESPATLVRQLKKRCWNKTYNVNKRNSSTPTEAPEDFIKKMKEECSSGTPSHATLKVYLRLTREYRKVDKLLPCPEHLKKYPALRIPELLLWEFAEKFGLELDVLRSRWLDALPKLLHYLKITVGDEDCEDVRTHKLVLQMPKFFRSGRKAVSKSRPIAEVFPEDTIVEEAIPKLTDPPRLVAFGDKDSKLQFVCYVDKVPLFTDFAVNAVLNLMAAYYVFNISYPAECKLPFTLISGVLLRDAVMTDVAKYPSVVAALAAVTST